MAVELLDYTKNPPPPEPGVFEFGLVLAGAVSAGAYTAGVLDFLIEALDAWEEAKRKSPGDARHWAVPSHRVRLRVVSGASAGGMTAAIAGIALNYGFSPVRPGSERPDANPFYRAWVRQIRLERLLEARDLASPRARVASLFDSTVLREILDHTLSFTGPAPPPRPYLGAAVRFIFTQTNLRGVPYFAEFNTNAGDQGLAMVAHADYQSFSLRYGAARAHKRPDDIDVDFPNSTQAPAWCAFGEAALASGAFPLGLAARTIERDAKLYDYRFVAVPTEDGKGAVRQLLPRWGKQSPLQPYSSVVVDGGTMNNEPLELARAELAGLAGRNPRGGNEANRAVVLVDPFPDVAGAVDDGSRGQSTELGGVIPALIGALKSQSRFSPVDLVLAQDEQVYSRFLIAPSRDADAESGGFSLACGALEGFAGFLCEAFRHHDYMLGRRNCQQFLRQHFALPIDNPLFDGVNPALKGPGSPHVSTREGRAHMAIIPLIGALEDAEPLERWPRDEYDVRCLDGVGPRLDAIVDRYLANAEWRWRWAARLVRGPLRGWAVDAIRRTVVAELGASYLVSLR